MSIFFINLFQDLWSLAVAHVIMIRWGYKVGLHVIRLRLRLGPKAKTLPSAVHENKSDNAAGQPFQNQGEGKESCVSDDSRSSSEEFEIAHCSICQSGITYYRYHKCTYCIEEINICDSCFIENRHSIHNKYIQTFTLNPDCLDNPKIVCCDSCGQVFPINDETMVWSCKICEDYCICEKCRFQDMHYVHQDNFKMIFIKAYIEII